MSFCTVWHMKRNQLGTSSSVRNWSRPESLGVVRSSPESSGVVLVISHSILLCFLSFTLRVHLV